MMTIHTSEKWDPTNLAHRYTVSFFKWKYGDEPDFITGSAERENQELNYYNISDPDNDVGAVICSGLLVNYMEAQGIPYHDGKTRKKCFNMLSRHLKKAEGMVLYTADIIDHHFKFLGEN